MCSYSVLACFQWQAIPLICRPLATHAVKSNIHEEPKHDVLRPGGLEVVG
jgi:hypothetical protein